MSANKIVDGQQLLMTLEKCRGIKVRRFFIVLKPTHKDKISFDKTINR